MNLFDNSNLGKAYIAPSISWADIPLIECNASVTIYERLTSDLNKSSHSLLNLSTVSSENPSALVGGVTKSPVKTYPTVFEQSTMVLALLISNITSSLNDDISMYPPLNPHSPEIPFEIEWKEKSSHSLL